MGGTREEENEFDRFFFCFCCFIRTRDRCSEEEGKSNFIFGIGVSSSRTTT